MRRFKITTKDKDVFADKNSWNIVDTWTGAKMSGEYRHSDEARKEADRLEAKYA